MPQLSTDPVDWLLGPDGDLVITSDVAWSRGIPAVMQSIRVAIQMVRGEWFLNDEDGVPLWERPGVSAAEALLGQPFSELKAAAAYREAIVSVPHTIRILSLEVFFDKSNRKLRVAWSVRTTFGDTPIESTVTG